MTPMNWIDETLADFGRRLGLAHLDCGAHGVAQLALAGGGLIAIEPVTRGDAEEVLVYVGRRAGHDAPRLLRQALIKAHHGQAGSLPVQVAMRGQGPDAMLLALLRLPAREFTPQRLDRAFDHLNRWLDALA